MGMDLHSDPSERAPVTRRPAVRYAGDPEKELRVLIVPLQFTKRLPFVPRADGGDIHNQGRRDDPMRD